MVDRNKEAPAAFRGRLAFVTQWFPPEPATIALGITRELKKCGWDVSVLTGMPNYPAGKLYPGYRSLLPRTDTALEMHVHRTPLYPYHGSSSFLRVLNYASWALSSLALGWRAFSNADVSLVYSSPATAALAAVVRRRFAGVPYVLMIQDLWPDSVFASGFLTTGTLSRIAHSLLTAFVEWTYAHASHIVVTSPGMVDVLEHRGVSRERISLVYNWKDESIFAPRPEASGTRELLGLTGEDFVVMYAGNLGAAQGLGTLIRAIGLLAPERRCHAILVGDGIEKDVLEAKARREAPGRVHFFDPLPPDEVAALMAAVDIQYISLADRPLFRHTMPSKVQATLATGVPSIVAVHGDAAEVVSSAGAGIAAAPGDPASIAAAIADAQDMGSDALREMGAAARTLYERDMAAAVGATALSGILESVARPGHSSGDCAMIHHPRRKWSRK